MAASGTASAGGAPEAGALAAGAARMVALARVVVGVEFLREMLGADGRRHTRSMPPMHAAAANAPSVYKASPNASNNVSSNSIRKLSSMAVVM